MGVGGSEREGPYAYMLVIHVVTQQKRPQHGKAIILQFKKKKKRRSYILQRKELCFRHLHIPAIPKRPSYIFGMNTSKVFLFTFYCVIRSSIRLNFPTFSDLELVSSVFFSPAMSNGKGKNILREWL